MRRTSPTGPALSRRTFTSLATGFFAVHGFNARAAFGPNEKLHLAVVGIGGQGAKNLEAVAHENIVALCDVDERRGAKGFERFPSVRRFTDFRRMFDAVEKQIDAVVISTPDHTHFHPAWWAMERGKHVYLEKPLAHEVGEVRRLTVAARERKLATQLGNQRHANKGLREAVAIVKSGVIGDVTEAHSWIASSRGMPKAPGEPEAVPPGLDWDLWLGPVPERPYTTGFAPYDWRFWWEFGTGETGNWGCHILDIPFWALDLVYPVHVSGSGPEPDARRTPTALTARLDYPARGSQPPVALHWHQGRPPIAAEKGAADKQFNTLFIGSAGTLACGFDSWKLLPEGKFADFKGPDPAIPPSPGFHREWLDACRGGPAASCNFDYSGPMTESVLLANIAYRIQGEFDWDAAALKSSRGDVDAFLRREYRKGWEA
jgi:predicted dehydrogenase